MMDGTDGLLPSLPGPHDDGDPAALCEYTTTLSRDGAGAVRAPSLLEDASSDVDDTDTMSNLSKALEMSSSSCSSPRTRNRPHRDSVSTISTIFQRRKQEGPSLIAKVSSILFRRNTSPGGKRSAQATPPAGRPDSETLAVKSIAAQSLRRQQELEDARYARVIADFRTVGWCSPSEIKSVEYERSLISAQWDEKISLLSRAQ